MKNWQSLLAILLILIGFSVGARAENINNPKDDDKWLAPDKLKHFSTSLFMTTTLFYGQSRIFNVQAERANQKAVGLTISLGVLKEWRDSRQPENYFSWRDLAIDILGVSTAVLILSKIG